MTTNAQTRRTRCWEGHWKRLRPGSLMIGLRLAQLRLLMFEPHTVMTLVERGSFSTGRLKIGPRSFENVPRESNSND
jgi:hypothetical protein